MRILICDDEPLAVERLSRLVTQLGHQVVATATHGQDALDLVEQYEPDVVLLDIQMPEMDGLFCAEQISHFDPMPAFVRLMMIMHWRPLNLRLKVICSNPFLSKICSRF